MKIFDLPLDVSALLFDIPHTQHFLLLAKEITSLFLSLLIFRSACYYWRWQYIGNVYKCCARIVSDDRCEECMLKLYRTPFSAMRFLLQLKNWRWFHETAYWSLIDQICIRSSLYKLFSFIACYFQIIEMQYRMFFRMIILMLNTFETNHEVFGNLKILNYHWNDYQYPE